MDMMDTKRMKLRDRVQDARAVASLSVVKSRDKFGRVRSLTAPGHDCYRLVLISRVSSDPFPKLAVECNRQTPIGLVPCEGNGRKGGNLCYHSIGAIEKALLNAPKGSAVKVLGWYQDESRARSSANLAQYKGARLGYVWAKKQGKLWSGLFFLWRAL